jgi:P27 family predicted phage terminase small subunit
MGSRGPSPKPTALRILQGNPGKIKLNPHEPKPATAAPDLKPPKWMDTPAQEVWMRLRPDLPWLTVADVDLFSAYCSTYVRWREAEDKISVQGAILVLYEPLTAAQKKQGDKKGDVKYIQTNPHISIAQKALLMICKLGAELGLSPASRTRIHIPQDEKPNSNDSRFFGT